MTTPRSFPLVTLLALVLPAVTAAQDALPRLRVADPRLRRIIDRAEARSPTLRALIAEIERSDVIVHVQVERVVSDADGVLRFATAAALARFLRISIRPGVPRRALAPLVAHELAHAVEIARHASVRDQRTMRALYERIGHRRGVVPVQFDTSYAVDAGRLVARELSQPGVFADH